MSFISELCFFIETQTWLESHARHSSAMRDTVLMLCTVTTLGVALGSLWLLGALWDNHDMSGLYQ